MLGSNVPTVGGLRKAFYWAKEWGCEVIQIYITLSRRWDVRNMSQDEVEKFLQNRRRSPVKKIVAHVPFLVNLASSDKDIWQKSKERLIKEIVRAEQLGVLFLVLHPGSYGGSCKTEGVKRIIDALTEVIGKTKPSNTKILLETMAGQGTTVGSRFEEIAEIFEKVGNHERLGVCFDTAHVFIAGYNIKGYQGYESVLDEFDKVVGLEKLKTFHLNDTKTEFGSRNDRHACIGEGKLGFQIFHALLRDKRFLNIPKILEIPDRDKNSKRNLKLLRRLRQIEKTVSEPKDNNYSQQLALEIKA